MKSSSKARIREEYYNESKSKILVSDYDQTFYLNDEDIEINKNKVKRFRELGNIFIIATGRSFLDFKNKKDIYDIRYDYVILNHGAIVLDSSDNVILNCVIDDCIIENLKRDLELDTAIGTFCCSKFESRVGFDYGNLTKIHVRYSNKETAMTMCDKLNQKYSDFINAYFVTGNGIEIISNKTNKSLAIEKLAETLGINKNNVYTIGDGYSDVEMIRKFNGYCMKESVEELKSVAKKEDTSVSMLIKELMGESKDE